MYMNMKLLISIFSFMFLLIFQFLSSNRPIESPRDVSQMIDDFIQTVPSLPRYMEGGYSPLGRSPVVDALLADPLYMPTYAETVASLIKENNQLFDLSMALFNAGGIPVSQLETQNAPPSPFLEAFTPNIAEKLYSYWFRFVEIQKDVKATLSVLSEEEKTWLKQNYNRFFFEKQEGEPVYDFFTSDNPYPFKFFELASRVDLAKLADCALALSKIADDFYQSKDEFIIEKDFIWEEANLKLIVSQKNHVEHKENADFFIDLGGYNTIRNNAGGTEGNRLLALHIDLKGNNTYEGQDFVQGCGFLGVGMLVNCSGNNSYNAASYSQGCGFFGAGLLVNMEGNNRFKINLNGQSFALFGSSILWNKQGGNTYLASQGMAQSASSTLGVAFLVENEGNNSFVANIGQGGSSGVRGSPWLNNPSFYGGLSFLYLGEGHNKLKAVWLGQGSAYFLGAGIVVAEGSNDVFEADYDAQGQGLHLAAGLLLKKGDHSYFNGGWGSLGVSGDRSIGMFINTGNHNYYEGTDQSVGSSRKPKSVGIFINIGGENTYRFKNISNANIQYPQSPKEWSSALFLEIGKNSSYPENVDPFTRGNDLHWGIENHSWGISTEAITKETLFAKFHSMPTVPFKDQAAYQPLTTADPQELLTATYDRRRQIYETLDLQRFKDRKNDPDLSHLLDSDVAEDAFNYAVLWALRNKEKVDLTHVKAALSNDSFKSEYARKMAVSLVGTFWTPDATPILAKIMQKDPSEEIRYFAALSLALNSPSAFTGSDSEVVRYAIARGLQESRDPSALNIVTPLFNDESFYVRRAAGLTALSLGDKKGVPVVLETLQFETLDTGDNYGDNIFKQLSTYLGVDFGLDKEAWINWWSKAKDE